MLEWATLYLLADWSNDNHVCLFFVYQLGVYYCYHPILATNSYLLVGDISFKIETPTQTEPFVRQKPNLTGVKAKDVKHSLVNSP